MAVRIEKKHYIHAIIQCATSIDKDKLEINFPDSFTQLDYWNKLSELNGLVLDEVEISSRRRKAYDAIKEIKFLRTVFNMSIKDDEGKSIHISSLWLKPSHKNIRESLLSIAEDEMSGQSISALIHEISNPEQHKNNDFKIWEDGKVIGNKGFEIFDPFIKQEAYVKMNPFKLFYPNGMGRGNKSSLMPLDSYDLI